MILEETLVILVLLISQNNDIPAHKAAPHPHLLSLWMQQMCFPIWEPQGHFQIVSVLSHSTSCRVAEAHWSWVVDGNQGGKELCCQIFTLQTSEGSGQAASLIPAQAMVSWRELGWRRHVSGFGRLGLSSSKDSKLSPESQRQRMQLQEQLLQKHAPVLSLPLPPPEASWGGDQYWSLWRSTWPPKCHTHLLDKEGCHMRQRKLCKPSWAFHLLCAFR